MLFKAIFNNQGFVVLPHAYKKMSSQMIGRTVSGKTCDRTKLLEFQQSKSIRSQNSG